MLSTNHGEVEHVGLWIVLQFHDVPPLLGTSLRWSVVPISEGVVDSLSVRFDDDAKVVPVLRAEDELLRSASAIWACLDGIGDGFLDAMHEPMQVLSVGPRHDHLVEVSRRLHASLE